jgi:PAS domain S-box-containing protein
LATLPENFPFRALLDAAPDGILVCDDRGTIVLVNNGTERIFGYDHDELNGKPIETLIPERVRPGHGGHVASFTSAPRLRQLGSNLDLLARRKDGSEFPAEIGLSPFATAGGLLIVASVRDVTDRRVLERELRAARALAEAASAAKSEFLSSMSHELRTPLNAILGFAQLLERDRKQPLSERQIERLGYVLRGGEHLLRLIDDVLDLSRIEAGRLAVSAEPVEVADVLAEVVHTLEPLATRAQIHIAIAPSHGELPRVLADRTRLAQILMNFGSNAIKYGKADGHVTFRIAPAATTVRIVVIDDGIGIPADKRDRIFEPFQRAGQEAGPIEGSGIGLTISKRLAEIMRGAVGFTSEVGRGSEFWIELAIYRQPAGEPARAHAAAEVGARLAGARRHSVVYVEDNPSNIAFMRDLIEEFPSVELLTAPTAELGLEVIRGRLPDVVILDINLPGMNGFEAAAQLRAWPETRAIPIIGLSAAALERDIGRARAAGFERYLTKPVKIDELTQALEELLER